MTERLTYTIEEAAERLGAGFTVDWLRARVKRREIPFVKSGHGTGRGGRVSFTEAHLARIVALHTVEPEQGNGRGDFTPVTRRRSA